MTCSVSAEFVAVKDNILYENTTGSLSNALGVHLYTGNNANGKRRSVISFDVSSIPNDAEIQSAQIKLYCNSSSGATIPVTLFCGA